MLQQYLNISNFRFSKISNSNETIDQEVCSQINYKILITFWY